MPSPEPVIGIVSADYHPPKGGLGRALQEMADTLRARGRTVRILSQPASAWGRHAGHLGFSALLPFRLRRWTREEGIGLLLYPVGPGGIFLPHVPSSCLTVAIVYHTYAQQARLVPGQSWKCLFLPWERASLRRARRVLCYAEDTRQALTDIYHLDVRTVHLLPQIFSLAFWSEKSAEPRRPLHCVCVARLEARKGVETVVRAWSLVRSMLPSATLTIVGSGIQASRIDSYIAGDPSIRRISGLESAELRTELRTASLALCPAYLEGFGLAAAEAMATGTPVIASDAEGLRSLLAHDRTGWLVPARDAEAWAAAIVRLLSDSALRERLAAAAAADIASRLERGAAEEALLAALGRMAPP